MARQVGEIKHQGTIGEIIFYKSVDGYLARGRGGIEAHRIAKDPAFERTRKNNAEFGNATAALKIVRDTVRQLSKKAEDSRLCSRLTKAMMAVKELDVSHAHGERSVANGLATVQGKQLLCGFNFNIHAPLHTVLRTSLRTVPATGGIIIDKLSPMNDVRIPEGATHIIFKAGYAAIDFVTGERALAIAKPVKIEIITDATTVELAPTPLPTIHGTKLMLLCIEFVQEVNGADYQLERGAHNVMCIVDVA